MSKLKISKEGLSLIRRFEGFSPMPYVCPAGVLTIGYGHVVQDKDVIGRGARITEAEAEQLLLRDLKKVASAIDEFVAVPLSQGQFDALSSFIYNVGIGAFARSTLLKHVNKGQWGKALAEFPRWNKARNKVLPGLVRRRAAEMELFEI